MEASREMFPGHYVVSEGRGLKYSWFPNWGLIYHRSSITFRHGFIQDGPPQQSTRLCLSIMHLKWRCASKFPIFGVVKNMPSLGIVQTRTAFNAFESWERHPLESWLMAVPSLEAMRERDLFGSFESLHLLRVHCLFEHLTGCISIAMWGISQEDVTCWPNAMP